MITTLKIIFSVLLVWITYVVISTSLESSLIKEWNFLGSIPWMRGTLWDFYANIFIITLWMFAKTLKLWFIEFNHKLNEVKALGFDEQFIRKWHYYLNYCEAAFEMRNINVMQMVYTRPNNIERSFWVLSYKMRYLGFFLTRSLRGTKQSKFAQPLQFSQI